jgi:hypothetical protein
LKLFGLGNPWGEPVSAECLAERDTGQR